VEREFKSILPKPYSNCEIDSLSPKFRPGWDLYNLVGQSKYIYSQQLCFSQCLQKYFIEKYNGQMVKRNHLTILQQLKWSKEICLRLYGWLIEYLKKNFKCL